MSALHNDAHQVMLAQLVIDSSPPICRSHSRKRSRHSSRAASAGAADRAAEAGEQYLPPSQARPCAMHLLPFIRLSASRSCSSPLVMAVVHCKHVLHHRHVRLAAKHRCYRPITQQCTVQVWDEGQAQQLGGSSEAAAEEERQRQALVEEAVHQQMDMQKQLQSQLEASRWCYQLSDCVSQLHGRNGWLLLQFLRMMYISPGTGVPSRHSLFDEHCADAHAGSTRDAAQPGSALAVPGQPDA